jgi:hypothetical protein
LRRIVWALVLSLPLSFLAFAIADNAKCPDLCRWFFSPGYVLSIHLPPAAVRVGERFGEEFSDNLERSLGIGLLTNLAYYYLILWASFVGFDLLRQKPPVEFPLNGRLK